jgi:hypothetical protein
MSNQYKLSIAAFLLVPMVFALADGDKEAKFDFKLQCERLSQDDWLERIKGDTGAPTDAKIKEVVLDITTGWRDQTLVLDADGQPAQFCREALEAMFAVPGVLELFIGNYRKEVLARVKN